MPEENVILRAREDAREGKAPSTQAGEFVREEIDHVRSGKHGARSVKQAIAIGLSKARKAGVKLPPNPNNPGAGEQVTRKRQGRKIPDSSRKRSQASLNALRRESTRTASPKAVSAQVKAAAANRLSAARKVAKTRRNTSGADTR
ncbi:MAG: DUF6496 domain-containing protein [Candidatus Acidiferrum sp.]